MSEMTTKNGLNFKLLSDVELNNYLSVHRLLSKLSAKLDADSAVGNTLQIEAGLKQCHVVAVALGEATQSPYSISIAVKNDINKHGELTCRSFAHAVVNINGQNYDANGSNAIALLESLYHPETINMFNPENDGSYSKFDWVEIAGSPSIDEVIKTIKDQGLECEDPNEEMANYLREAFSDSQRSPAP